MLTISLSPVARSAKTPANIITSRFLTERSPERFASLSSQSITATHGTPASSSVNADFVLNPPKRASQFLRTYSGRARFALFGSSPAPRDSVLECASPLALLAWRLFKKLRIRPPPNHYQRACELSHEVPPFSGEKLCRRDDRPPQKMRHLSGVILPGLTHLNIFWLESQQAG